MPLKIIGAGFGRTGTDSTRLALNQLGFPCYHMREVFGKTAHLDFWLKVANAPAGTQHASPPTPRRSTIPPVASGGN